MEREYREDVAASLLASVLAVKRCLVVPCFARYFQRYDAT
jgi:hypothetical protein